MAWNRRNEFSVVGALTAAIVVTVSLAVSPASADEPCDLTLRAAVNGGTTTGDLEVMVMPGSDRMWIYSVTTPTGYSLEWLDGVFPVTTSEDAAQIGGGLMTREPSLTGEFVQLSACFRLDVSQTARPAVWEMWPGVALL
jgi:hypothetical protein